MKLLKHKKDQVIKKKKKKHQFPWKLIQRRGNSNKGIYKESIIEERK